MTVEVEIGGRLHRVEVERRGSCWVVTRDGRTVDVDVVPAGTGMSLLIGSRRDSGGDPPGDLTGDLTNDLTNAASYDVTMDAVNPGEFMVNVGGQALHARIVDRRAWRRDRAGTPDRGSRTVTSTMPGRVVKVLIKCGDRVVERQPLVVVEAMKMENELRAPCDAVVREVTVGEGASVEAGAILVVLE